MNNDPKLRVAPHSIELEKSLLGTILMNNSALDSVQETLLPEHFYTEAHQYIYDSMLRLKERGKPVDGWILRRLFEMKKTLETVGGDKYLAELASCAMPKMVAADYAKQIFDYWRRRELIYAASETIEKAFSEDADSDASTYIEGLEQNLYNLTEEGSGGGEAVHVGVALQESLALANEAFKADGNFVGVSTGIPSLDDLLGGLRPTNLYILAGRPSMGKTALAVNIAKAAGGTGGVGLFSLEMSREQLAQRLQSEETGIDSHQINLGRITLKDIESLTHATETLSECELYIDDTPAINTAQLRARARKMVRKYDIKVLIVDYLQLLEPPPTGNRNDSPVAKTTAISKALKTLAKELYIPVIALSQLSRAVEQRVPPRPMLSDLRESGSIEQDADVVMFIYRQAYYLARDKAERKANESEQAFAERGYKIDAMLEECMDKAEVIVAKQRHGPIGNTNLQFDGARCQFSDVVK